MSLQIFVYSRLHSSKMLYLCQFKKRNIKDEIEERRDIFMSESKQKIKLDLALSAKPVEVIIFCKDDRNRLTERRSQWGSSRDHS